MATTITQTEEIVNILPCFQIQEKDSADKRDPIQLPFHRLGKITAINLQKRCFGVDLDIYDNSRDELLQELDKHFFDVNAEEEVIHHKVQRSRDKLIKPMNAERHPVIVGRFYAAYIEGLEAVARIKVTGKASPMTYNVRLIDYGAEDVINECDIGVLPSIFASRPYDVAYALTCQLPDEQLMKSCKFPALEKFKVGSTIEVYILSAQEPCLAVFGSRIKPNKLRTETFLYGIDQANVELASLFLTCNQLPNCGAVGMSWASSYWPHHIQPTLVSTVDVTPDMKLAVRDVLTSMRYAAVTETIQRDYGRREYRQAMVFGHDMIVPGTPVVALWKEKKAFIRGTVIRMSPELNVCNIEAIDVPNLILYEVPFQFLFSVSTWLLGVPPQITYVDLIVHPEDTIYHRVMPLIKELLAPGRVLLLTQDSENFSFEIETVEGLNVRSFLDKHLQYMLPMNALTKKAVNELEKLQKKLIGQFATNEPNENLPAVKEGSNEQNESLPVVKESPPNCDTNAPPKVLASTVDSCKDSTEEAEGDW